MHSIETTERSRGTHYGCAGGIWSLYLGTVLLGKIDEATMKVYG